MFKGVFKAVNKLLKDQGATLPYPEEPPDFNLSYTREQLLQKFFVKYFISEAHWDFWKTVTIVIDKTITYPAGMVSETKTLLIRPEYTNPGVLAHEFSHLSYAQLNETQKAYFPQDYVTTMQKDGLLRLLYSQKPEMNKSIIETHAEIFRYLGIKMPEALKKYYPRLIG